MPFYMLLILQQGIMYLSEKGTKGTGFVQNFGILHDQLTSRGANYKILTANLQGLYWIFTFFRFFLSDDIIQ